MEYWSDGVLGSSTLVVVSLFRNDLNGAKRLNDWNVWNERHISPLPLILFPANSIYHL
jgi:hypothetical protein